MSAGLPVVTVRRDIAAAPDQVWRLIAEAGHLTQFHPFCAANPTTVWPGVGARDHVEYYNGRRLQRDFVAWHDSAGYDIALSDASGAVADVSWRLVASEAGASLSITIAPTMFGRHPGRLRRLQLRAVVVPMLRRYLRAVLDGLDWRLRTGAPVRRNQFGSHMWFSRRTR